MFSIITTIQLFTLLYQYQNYAHTFVSSASVPLRVSALAVVRNKVETPVFILVDYDDKKNGV